MKHLTIILAVLFSMTAKSQQRFPTGFPTQTNLGWNKWGYAMSDSGLIVANRDTNWLAKYSGTVVFRPSNKKFYWFDSTTLTWNKFADAIDTTSLSNRINLKLNISDTSSMLSPYLRKVDTTNKWVQDVYVRNDSLFKFKNGTETFIDTLGGGGGGSGTVTSVGLSLPSAFNVTPSSITTSGTFAVTGAGTTSQYIRGNGTLATTDTGMIPNFHLKVRSLFSGSSPITFSQVTGIIDINNANTTGTKGAASFTTSFSDNGSGVIDLVDLVSAGSCTGCILNIDAKGRIISYSTGAGGATNNVNIGSGLRPVNEGTQEMRTYFTGFGNRLDSVSNTNGLTWSADTTRSTGLPTYFYIDSSLANYIDTVYANNGLSNLSDSIQLGQAVSAVGNPAALHNDREIPLNGFRIGLSGTGSFGVGTNAPSLSYRMTVVGTGSTAGINVSTATATGINVSSTNTGISSFSSTGTAVNASTSGGAGNYAVVGGGGIGGTGGRFHTTFEGGDASPVVLELERFPTGAGVTNGAGFTIMFKNAFTSGATGNESGRITNYFSNAVSGSQTSAFGFHLVNNAVSARKALLAGSGQWTWDGYPALTQQTDTTNIKPIGYNTSTGLIEPMANWVGSGGGSPQGITRTLLVGNIDTATVIQFGYQDTGFVQQVSGADHIGTPFILYPYSARDTNIVNPKPIRGFKTYTNQYDVGYPLNTITEIYGYGSYDLNDHMFRIAHEQNWYNNGEFHLGYKIRGMGSEIRLFSPTWDWDTPDLSTTTFRAGQFAFQPVLSDTQMLSMTPGQTTITGFRSSVPAFRVQLFSNDGTKSGILMNTQANQTYINWHLNTVTPNNHSIVWDLPGSLIMGCARTGASSDPEFDLRFANISNNRMVQWKRGTRIMGVLNSGTGGNDHWVMGGEYTSQMSNTFNVKTYRSYAQKPFGVAITDAADVITKAAISTDTLGRVRINVPSPNTAWADGLLGVTETEDLAVYGSTVLVDNNSGLNRILALKNTHVGSFSGPSLKFWNNGGTTGTNGYGFEFYSNNTTGGFANAMIMRNYEGGPTVFYGQSAEIARFNNAGALLIGTTTDNGAKLQVNGKVTIATVDSAAGPSNMLWIDPTTKEIKKAAVPSGGITTLNSLTAATQTFATGTSGTDFNIVSGSSTHTFNIPSASVSNRGLVTTTSQSFAGGKTFTSGIVVNNVDQAAGAQISGDRTSSVAPGVAGIALSVPSFTYTSSAGAGTETQGQNFNVFGSPTLTSSNAITYTGNVVSALFSGAPIAGGSSTIDHPYSIYANDVSRFAALSMALNEQSGDATIGNASGVNIYTGAGGHTFTLPALSMHPGKIIFIKNAGGGNLTVARAGSDNIYDTSSVTSITVAAGASAKLMAGSTFWYVLN